MVSSNHAIVEPAGGDDKIGRKRISRGWHFCKERVGFTVKLIAPWEEEVLSVGGHPVVIAMVCRSQTRIYRSEYEIVISNPEVWAKGVPSIVRDGHVDIGQAAEIRAVTHIPPLNSHGSASGHRDRREKLRIGSAVVVQTQRSAEGSSAIL